MNDKHEVKKGQDNYHYDVEGESPFYSNYNDLDIGKTIASEKLIHLILFQSIVFIILKLLE